MKRLVALLALLVLGASACTYGGTPANPAALSIDGSVVLSVDELEEELDFLATNTEMAGALLGDPSALEGQVTGAYSPAAAATVLNLHLQMHVIEQVAEEKGVAADEAALEEARTQLTEQLDGLGVSIDDLPTRMADDLVAGTAANQALALWIEENPVEAPEVTDEDIQAFFDENRSQLPDEVVCSRHILVAFPTDPAAEPGQPAEPSAEDDAAARAEIDDAAARLEAGEDFAAVAEEVSDDPGSGALGGELGCGDPAQFVPEFAEAVATQELDQVGEPVRTQYGYHLIEVTYRGEPTAELFEEEIRTQLESQNAEDPSARFNELLLAAAQEADVVVDPAFGTWDPEAGGIVGPEGAADPPGPPVDPLADLELP